MATVEDGDQAYVKVLLPEQLRNIRLKKRVPIVELLLNFAIQELAIDEFTNEEEIEMLVTLKISDLGTYQTKRKVDRGDDSYYHYQSDLSTKRQKGVHASISTSSHISRYPNRSERYNENEKYEESYGEDSNSSESVADTLDWKTAKNKDSDDSDIEMLGENIRNGSSSAAISNNVSAAAAISTQATATNSVPSLATAPTLPSVATPNIHIYNVQAAESPEKRTLSSTALGQRGEKSIEDILKKISFVGYDNTSKTPHSGDFEVVMRETNTTVLIEVKNITNVVPTSDVDKFLQDLSSKKVEYGIFISKKCRIAGKQLVEIGYHPTTTVLYLSSFDESVADPEVVLTIALYWVKCLVNVKTKYEREESEIEREYVIMFDDLIRECSSYMQQIASMRKLINKHKEDVNVFVDDCLHQVSQLDFYINQVLEKFKKTTTVSSNDLEGFLEKTYKVTPGIDVPLADIVTLCKAHGFKCTQLNLKQIFAKWKGCIANKRIPNANGGRSSVPVIGNLQKN